MGDGNETGGGGGGGLPLYEIFDEQTYAAILGCIAGIGIIGNIILFSLMFTSSFKHFSSSVYLRYIAVCDSAILIQTAAEDIIEKYHGFDQLESTFFQRESSCYIWTFIYTLCRFTSPWLVGILGIDRFIAIVFPLYRNKFCRKRYAHVCSWIVIFASFILQFFIILCQEETACHVGSDFCSRYQENEVSFFIYQTFIKTHIPLLVILVFNTWTIIVLRRRPEWKSTTDNRKTDIERAIDRTTFALVTMSLISFVALFPKAVVEIFEIVMLENEDAYDAEKKRDVDYAWHITNAIMLLNFAQNFYILVAASPLYRRALRTCCKSAPDDDLSPDNEPDANTTDPDANLVRSGRRPVKTDFMNPIQMTHL